MAQFAAKGLALGIALSPLLMACGGGGTPSDPGTINVAQCTGSSCPPSGPTTNPQTPVQLCPAALDNSTTFIGGTGSGEYVHAQFNTAASTYTITFVDSPIPNSAGQVNVTRAGLTVAGSFSHPTTLPSAEQNRCAFVLGPSSTADGSYKPFYNAKNPPIIFIGNGVAGGGVPGAEISFAGIAGLGAVADRKFDFYPFIGFSSTETTIANVAGTYNALLYHLRPSPTSVATTDNYTTAGVADPAETLAADGSCTPATGAPGGVACETIAQGQHWTSTGDGAFVSSIPPNLNGPPFLVIGPNNAKGYMIVGKLNGALVPVVIRRGYIDADTSNVLNIAIDDESGIGLMAPVKTLAASDIAGGYVGADANFYYPATLIQNTTAAFLNPNTSHAIGGFGLSYAQTVPGLIGVQDASGNQGGLVAVGGVYGVLLNGTENGGIADTGNGNTVSPTNSPYFGIGAFVSK